MSEACTSLRSVSEDGLQHLQTQLRDEPPAGIAALDGTDLTHLAGLIGDARRRQAAELSAARERAMSGIPRLLRGPIRRVVG